MTEQREDVVATIERYFDDGDFLAELRRRVEIRTESQEPTGQSACWDYLEREIKPVLEAIGYDISIHNNPDNRYGPFLVGCRHEGETLPTLLTYGHGDVVRGLPEQWRDGLDPWAVTVEGTHWYGRGTADNKGQHSVVIAALRQLLLSRGKHGFNSKILIEMGEEIGSPGLDAFCAQEADLLAADVFIASDGPRLDPRKADVSLGNRGGIAFELLVDLRAGSQHSGHWGGVLKDPGIILAQALASLTDRHGRILVPEWLPKNIPPKVMEAIRGLPFDPASASFDIPTGWGEPGLSVPEKIYAWTGFIILAYVTGRPENPVNGVQPWAKATCQLRFTADADHQQFLPALRRHLDGLGFEDVQIKLVERNFFPAWRTDPDNPWVDWILESVARTTGEHPNLVPNSSGGLPSEIFARHLNLPVIWIPHSYSGCKQHGPDEHVLAPMVREALAIMTGLFWDLGEAPPSFEPKGP